MPSARDRNSLKIRGCGFFKHDVHCLNKLVCDNIKEVIIHNTKNPPPTRCYLTSEYSPKLKKIICLGGSDINSEQYSKIDLYDPNKHRWENYPHHFEIFNRQLSGQSSNLVNISVNNINDQERKT